MFYVKEIELVLPYTGSFKFNKNNIDQFFDTINRCTDERDYLYSGVIIHLEDENEEEEEEEQISENIEHEENNMIYLSYTAPKELAFTQKFQDRIKKEVPAVIDTIYPDIYNFKEILYSDNGDDTMNLNFIVESLTEENGSKYLDKDVGFTIDDIINYYKK